MGIFQLSNRVSYALGLCGPSVTIDTACSGSGCALDIAYRNIQDGVCDAAIVGGTHICLSMASTVGYNK
jgi:acyl transferase domain-containing protein